MVVASDPSAPVTGRAADVIQAAATCFEAAARLMRPGKPLSEVSATLNKIAEAYGCTCVGRRQHLSCAVPVLCCAVPCVPPPAC